MATTCAAWRWRSGANCLEQVLTPGRVVRISDVFPGAGEALLEAARENGLEGVIAKHPRSMLRIAAQPRVAEDQDRDASRSS